MAVAVSYPGVYVQEVPSGVRTITGVSTSTTLFIGMTARGVSKKPIPVRSFTDYQRKFGTGTATSEMTDQVRQFFQNGGTQAYVMRIANLSSPSSVSLTSEVNQTVGTRREVLKISAKEDGAQGDSIRLEVDYDTPAPESTFNIRVFRQVSDGQGGFDELEEETFQNLSMDPANGNYAVNLIKRRSSLINAELGADIVGNHADVAPFKGYALSGRLFSDATDLKDAIHDAIKSTGPGGTGTLGRFRISVDGNPFVVITIAVTDITSADPAGKLADAINNSNLLPPGAKVNGNLVTGPGSLKYLQISSDITGGSVVFGPAASEDIAHTLQLGLDSGGLEVGGYARRRPAPSGLFFRLGNLHTLSTPAPALSSLAGQNRETIAKYTLNDSAGSHTTPASFSLGTSGAPIYEEGGQNSLRHVKARLEIIANAVNDHAAADPNFNWFAAVHGYRLVLAPDFGNANNTSIAFSTSPTYDLGASSKGLDHPNTRYYSVNANGTIIYQKSGLGGIDGTIPIADDYAKAFKVVDSDVDLFNLMVLPRASGQSDSQREEVWGPASVFCQHRRAFLLVDPRETWGNVDLVKQEIPNLRIGLVKDHAAIFWPQITIRDPITGVPRDIDPSGSVAGVMARVDANRGVWKAPAGLGADIRGVRGVKQTMSDPENGIINPVAVNAIRLFPNGIVSWGARTMDGFDNSGNDDYKYIPVRRLALFMEESLYRGLKFAVFEPNDEPLWAQIRLAAGAFMNNLFRQGAFQGQRARDAYFVKCDSETTTQNDINLGIVNVLVGFAPLKPAEFVIITIQQKAGQVQT